MNLTAKDVAEITRLLEGSAFDELYLESNGVKLTIRRSQNAAGETTAASPAAALPSASLSPSPSVADPASPSSSSVVADGSALVPAPMLGTFYRAPKPGSPPYVEVGVVVEPDTIVGIIEVMKLMNTVRAGMRGTVLEILARDGALVEYGEALMRVSRAD